MIIFFFFLYRDVWVVAFFLILIELCDVFRLRLFRMYENVKKFELFKVKYNLYEYSQFSK